MKISKDNLKSMQEKIHWNMNKNGWVNDVSSGAGASVRPANRNQKLINRDNDN